MPLFRKASSFFYSVKGVTLISEWERNNQMTENHAYYGRLTTTAEPAEYSTVLNHLLGSTFLGPRQLWSRNELVKTHEASYSRPDITLYLDTLRKDRRNGKKLEYIYSTGTKFEQALWAFELFRPSTISGEHGCLFHILESSLRATKELLVMATSHVLSILTKGASQARQVADFVESNVEETYFYALHIIRNLR